MHDVEWGPLLERTAAATRDWLAALPERPVPPRVGYEELLARFDRPVPEDPTPPEKVLDELLAELDDGLMATPSGRFFGWVIGGVTPAALAVDQLVTAWDQNAGMTAPAPAATAVETVTARWLLDLLDLPEDASVGFVTGGQVANFVCLAAARDGVLRAVGWDVEADGLIGAPPLTVLVHEETHDTVLKALRLLGLGDKRAVVLPSDGQGRLSLGALPRALADVDGAVIVCTQAGNVNTGSFDPLRAIAAVVDEAAGDQRDRAWIHVDGAFGLWAAADPERAHLLDGARLADSWSTDAHKMLNTPYDCGIAISRHPAAHIRSMTMRGGYLPADTDLRTPVDYVPELSRRARSLPVHAVIRELGRSGIAELVSSRCDLARRFADQLAALDGVTVLNDVVFNQVLVRFADPAGRDDDAHTRAVVQRVVDSGLAFFFPATWHGMTVVRISVTNWRTDEGDVDRCVAAFAEAHAG